MKVNLSYIALCMLLLPLLFCSCGADNVDRVADAEPVLVTFALDVETSSVTRAENDNWGSSGYDRIIGTGIENNIDTSSLLVVVYDADGKYVTELPILHYDSANSTSLTFMCALPEDVKAGKPYRYMVLANCTTKNYGISYTDGEPSLEKLVFETPFTQTIPMWGVTTYKFDDKASDKNKINVSLLRAAAKVGVKLTDALYKEGYRISGLKLNYANASGYSVPAGWNDASSTENTTLGGVFRPNTDAGLLLNVNASWQSITTPTNENPAYYIYVPETENLSNAFTPAKTDDPSDLAISVNLKKVEVDEDGKEVVVDTMEFPYTNGIRFRYYSSGQPTGEMFDIVRNHFYDYTIKEINLGLKMNLEVADWEDEPVWNLDFSAPVNTNLLTAPDAKADAPTAMPTMRFDNSDAKGEAGAFVGYFRMESPEGSSWKPTLDRASSTDYEVRVYASDGIDNNNDGQHEYDVLVTTPSIPADGSAFYKVVVVPLDPNNVGNVIRLGLTHTASWNAEANPLLIINKGNNGLYYPDTNESPEDDDVHWIQIKQVGSN